MSDQAYNLRKLVLDAAPHIDADAALPPTIVVAGGKGGVGTTTVAINLAAALAQSGRRTALVDAAPNADVAPMLGVDVDRGASLADVLSGTCAAADALRSGPAGMTLLAGEWAAERISRSFEPVARAALRTIAVARTPMPTCSSSTSAAASNLGGNGSGRRRRWCCW